MEVQPRLTAGEPSEFSQRPLLAPSNLFTRNFLLQTESHGDIFRLNDSNARITLSATESRQGEMSFGSLYALIAGLTLSAAAMIAVAVIFK